MERSREIQESMEEDMRVLQRVLKEQEQDRHKQTARRQQALADIEWMKEEMALELQREKEREAKLSQLYQEEAERMFRQQEARWERERLARQRLMAEVGGGGIKRPYKREPQIMIIFSVQVYGERQKQLEEKMRKVAAEQAESIKQREELLDRLEQIQQEEEERKLQQQRSVRFRREELDSQVAVRQAAEDDRRAREFARAEQERLGFSFRLSSIMSQLSC